jgi:hypothetical protein
MIDYRPHDLTIVASPREMHARFAALSSTNRLLALALDGT